MSGFCSINFFFRENVSLKAKINFNNLFKLPE